MVLRALALLQLAEETSAPQIAKVIPLTPQAIRRLGHRYQQAGLDGALYEKQRPAGVAEPSLSATGRRHRLGRLLVSGRAARSVSGVPVASATLAAVTKGVGDASVGRSIQSARRGKPLLRRPIERRRPHVDGARAPRISKPLETDDVSSGQCRATMSSELVATLIDARAALLKAAGE